MPDVVVRPRDVEEVADIVALARREGVAITPRAGASTSLGGCVPVRGGVVLDLSALKGVVSIDLEAKTACVLAGTVWTDLERVLARHGLEPMAVPSSASASSVGGWLCTGGYGIGSLKYGPFVSQVRSIEAVLADASVRRLSSQTNPQAGWFVGSEGTLGVVTEVELVVRRMQPMDHALLACPDVAAVHEAVRKLLAHRQVPFSIHFDDRQVLSALAELGYAPSGWDGSHLVRVDWEGSPDELEAARASMNEVQAAVDGTRLLAPDAALGEWRERFRALRVKRGGPSVIGAELLLPLSELERYMRDVRELARRHATRLMTYGHLASPDSIIIMTMYYTDETRTMDYMLDLGLVKKLHDAGAVCGGAPYGLGFWNTPHVRPRQGSVSPAELLRRKRQLDAAGIMNPGKGVARLALMNPSLVRMGMEALATARRIPRPARR